MTLNEAKELKVGDYISISAMILRNNVGEVLDNDREVTIKICDGEELRSDWTLGRIIFL